MTTKILQIVPAPPYTGDGISDYASLLASRLWQDYGIETNFLVFRTDLTIDSGKSKFPIIQLSSHNSHSLVSAIPEKVDAIILHFSGYPYFDSTFKGLLGINTPFWLAEALQSVVHLSQTKLILMVHELPRLNRGQFYLFDFLNPIQNLVSRRIARMADTVLTSSNRYQVILSKWLGKNVAKVSIFSNIGEPDSIPPLLMRKRRLVIFGGSARYRLYQNDFQALIQSCKLLGIEEIYDVGPPLKLPKYSDLEVNLVEMGFQSQREISELLLTSLAGCMDYSPFPGNLGKSGVFAAYCAHGVVPILTQYNPSEADGLHLNQHYVIPGDDLNHLSLAELQTIADNAHTWYQTHTLKAIAQVFAQHLLDQKENSLG